MNTPTLSQLADIGAKAACKAIPDEYTMAISHHSAHFDREQTAREAFAKAVLDAVGYKLPVDPEREAFDACYQTAQIPQGETQAFASWKAGRDNLRQFRQEQANNALDAIIPQTAKPAPETFEAHGLTWFKHTPGDPCPCDPTARTNVLWEEEVRGSHVRLLVEAAGNADWDRASGWRYADS